MLFYNRNYRVLIPFFLFVCVDVCNLLCICLCTHNSKNNRSINLKLELTYCNIWKLRHCALSDHDQGHGANFFSIYHNTDCQVQLWHKIGSFDYDICVNIVTLE